VDVEDALIEFFYVDVDRVRSLLAQIQGGVVDSMTSESTHGYEAGAQATVFGIGGHGDFTRESRRGESRSLQDLTFVAFEQVATDGGWIRELGSDFNDPAFWASGEAHEQLTPGTVIRITCDVQVLDGGLFRDRVNRYRRMADALARLTTETQTAASTKQAKILMSRAREAIMGDEQKLQAMSDVVESFVGDSVSCRVLPCGPDHIQFGFSGALLGRREYMQEERENLFSRYGSLASSWTAVLQVAAVPKPPNDDAPTGAISSLNLVSESGTINRAAVEGMAGSLLGVLEAIGLVEGPRWPTVSVTPLGIYRRVYRS
jgi:hypothetical protein